MVKSETRLGLKRAHGLSCATVKEMKARAQLRAPAIVLDIGTPAQREPERIDDVGELREHDPPLSQPKRMHVGGLAQGLGRDDPGLGRVGIQDEDPVAGARSQLGGVVEQSPGTRGQGGDGRW